jgi:hypothetical protein
MMPQLHDLHIAQISRAKRPPERGADPQRLPNTLGNTKGVAAPAAQT